MADANTPPRFAKPMISTAPAANAVQNRIHSTRVMPVLLCGCWSTRHCRHSREYDKTHAWPQCGCELVGSGIPSPATQPGNCLNRFAPRLLLVSHSRAMETQIDFEALQFAELIRLGTLAAEAMALSQEYDSARSRVFCELVAACNVEVLVRRRRAARHCGTALAISAPRGGLTSPA